MPIVSEEAIKRVAKQAEMGTTYLVLMSTAGVLAAVALLTNSIPVLIGAMTSPRRLRRSHSLPSPSRAASRHSSFVALSLRLWGSRLPLPLQC